MDNEYNNDYYESQPRKPFNEKDGAQEPASGAAPFSFNPEKPLMNRDEPQPAQERAEGFEPAMPYQQPQYAQPPRPQAPPEHSQGFNPIEHTATYADNRFVYNGQQGQRAPQYQGYYPPSYNQPLGVDYSNPVYYGNRPQEPYGGMPPVYGNAQPPYANPVQNSAYLPAQQLVRREEPKPKGNKGLIAVIVVLSILLAASLVGVLVFSVANSSRGSSSSNSITEKRENNGGSENELIPEFTFPIDTPEKETEPPETHEESDYSDKTDKNFKGVALADKPDEKDSSKYGSEYAYKNTAESVVGVMCYLDSDDTDASSEGSGIILTADGYIVTNAHVVGNSKTMYKIKVVDSDGKKYTAGVVGFDTRTDIAVLKIDGAKNLKAAQFGNSDKLALGEDILIIGNPGGLDYQNSMTKGVVSAIDREASSKSLVKYIQTDAAINPGNSGGPAVNYYGQVVGIASAKIVDEKYEGMGFCIPSATAKGIIDSLVKNGYVEGRVKIGISGVAITSSEAQLYSVPKGIMVESVDKDGPCGKTDLKQDDIITKVDGKTITSFTDIYTVLESHKAGDKVKLVYYRASDDGKGKETEVEITLQEDK